MACGAAAGSGLFLRHREIRRLACPVDPGMLSTGQILTDHMPFPVTREIMSLPFGIGKNAQAMTNGPQDQLSDPTAWLIAVRDRRDRDAFAQLFRYYAPRLRAMLARTGCRGAAADDIIQDALMRVWHSAGQFDASRASASAWVYRIARNRQIDVLRRTARPVPEALKAEDPPDPDASSQVAFDQEARRLRGALDRLSPDQRAVIEQAYMGELSHSEISAATGLPLGTIKSRIRLALDRLRHDLRDLRAE